MALWVVSYIYSTATEMLFLTLFLVQNFLHMLWHNVLGGHMYTVYSANLCGNANIQYLWLLQLFLTILAATHPQKLTASEYIYFVLYIRVCTL